MGIRSVGAGVKGSGQPKDLFGWVDLFKLFFAIMVAVSHTHAFLGFPKPVYYGSMVFTRLAVPYFFVASGFLLFRKISETDSGSHRIFFYLRRIAKLYIIWTLIYSPFMIRDVLRATTSGSQVLVSLLRTVFLVGYHHLWYLLALIVAVVLIYILRRLRFNNAVILSLGFVAYIVGLLGEEFYQLSLRIVSSNNHLESVFYWYFKIFDSTRNGMFDALLFVAFGMIIASHPVKLHATSLALLFILSCVGLELEAFLVHGVDVTKDGVIPNDLFICMIPGAFFAFILSNRILVPVKFSTIHVRNLSTIIYFVHPWVQYIVVVMERCTTRLVGGTKVEFGNMLSFLVVLLICLVIYRGILYLERFSGLGWLRHLYR